MFGFINFANERFIIRLFTIVLGTAELLRIIESIYRAISNAIDDYDYCSVIPSKYEVLSGLYLLFYRLFTFWIPLSMMIKLLWISKEQFSYRKEDVNER